jgi:PEP-CTERM motif
MKRLFKGLFSAAVAASSFGLSSVQAAPVTLQWVTTSGTNGGVTYLNQPATGSSAGVSASFVLADAALLQQSVLNFRTDGDRNGAALGFNSIVSANMNSSDPFVLIRTSLYVDPNSTSNIYQFCNFAVRDQAGQGTTCRADVALIRDTTVAGRYSGSLTIASNAGNSSVVGPDRISWGGAFALGSGILPVSGYWQVLGGSNVPLPGSVLLFGFGLAALAMRSLKGTRSLGRLPI